MKWLFVSAFLMIVPSILSENVFLLDISPEEAQKRIAGQSLDVKYANKFGENPLPAFKNDKGEFFYQGRAIDDPNDYVEEHYLADQFHGQDGLGRAMFGYSDWNQGRLEAINANGDVRGTYQYVDPHGKDIIVKYWSDSLGFHQEDNIPKVELTPVTDTPVVRKAKEEHFRLWQQAADRAKENPDPNSDYYNRHAIKLDQEQEERDQVLEILGGAPDDQLRKYPKLPYNKHIHAGSELSAAGSDDSVVINSSGRRTNQIKTKNDDEEEATGPPRGFFYSFEYPVQLVRETPARRLRNEQETNKVKRQVAKTETVKATDPEEPQQPQLARISLKAVEEGSIPIDAVHDAQVHPKQKSTLENSQVLPVLQHN